MTKQTAMDWDKVKENLQSQTAFYTAKANEYSTLSGYHELVREYRASANVASILLSAVNAGLVTADLRS